MQYTEAAIIFLNEDITVRAIDAYIVYTEPKLRTVSSFVKMYTVQNWNAGQAELFK